MLKNIKILCSIVLVFTFCSSCQIKYTIKEEAEFINSCHLKDFSKLPEPSKRNLQKLENSYTGSTYYFGIYLKESNSEEHIKTAKKYLSYAYKKSSFPFQKLAEEALYTLLQDEEKLIHINKQLKNKTLPKDKQNILLKEKYNLLFCLGKISEIDTPIDEYLLQLELTNKLCEKFLKIENIHNVLQKETIEIMTARIFTFKTMYKDAWQIFQNYFEDETKFKYLQNRKILSDAGKAALFSINTKQNFYIENLNNNIFLFEKYFDKSKKILLNKNDNVKKYMYAFYAARLNLKAGNTEKAVYFFQKALTYSLSENDYDNALWYILDIKKNISFDNFLEEIYKTSGLWKNGYIYEDLVSYACMKLAKIKNITGLQKLYNSLLKTNLTEASLKCLYILTRLTGKNKEQQEILNYIIKNSKPFSYYSLMSKYYLDKDEQSDFHSGKIIRKNTSELNREDMMKVINGFFKYKLYNKVYQFIIYNYPVININDTEKICRTLEENNYYTESLKLILFSINSKDSKYNEDSLKFAYPRPYYNLVKRYSDEFNVPEYLLYALIRSESFFKKDAVSYAGAIGLTQLMKSTADDIARKLKIEKYDLTDPETNIRFGAYYLSNMIKRNDGKIIYAIFSYNAGPNAVKRWKKQNNNLQDDIFLESLPYEETRNYAKNVISAAVIYAHLYYEKTYKKIISEIYYDLM